MSDVNEDLIRNLYAKYAPEVDVDSKIEHIQNTYGNNQDSFVENFYRKYSPDTDVSGKLDYINSKYPVTEVKKKEETEETQSVSDSQEEVTESTTEVQETDGSSVSVEENQFEFPTTVTPGIIKDQSMRPATEVEQEVFTEKISKVNAGSDLEFIKNTTERKVIGRDPQGEVMSVNKVGGISNQEAKRIQENKITDFANLYLSDNRDEETIQADVEKANLYKQKRKIQADIKDIDLEMRSLLQFKSGDKIIPIKVEELRGEDKRKYDELEKGRELLNQELNQVTGKWAMTRNPYYNEKQVYDPFTGKYIDKINAPESVIEYSKNVDAQAKRMSETTAEDDLMKLRNDLYYDVLRLSKQVKRNVKDVIKETSLLGGLAANFQPIADFPDEKDNTIKNRIPLVMSEHPFAKQLNEKLRELDAVNRAVELNRGEAEAKDKPMIDISAMEKGFIGTILGDEYSKNPNITFSVDPESEETRIKITRKQPLVNALKEGGFTGEEIDRLEKESELTFGEETQELGGNIMGMVTELQVGGGALNMTKIPQILSTVRASRIINGSKYGAWGRGVVDVVGGGITEGTKFAATGILLDKQEQYDPLLGTTFGVVSPIASYGSSLLSKLPGVKIADDVLSASVPGFNTGKVIVGKGTEAGVTVNVIYASELFDKIIFKGEEAGIAWDEVVYGKTADDPEGVDPLRKASQLWGVMLASGLSQKGTYKKFHDALGKDILESRGRKINWNWVKSQAPKPKEGEAYTDIMLIEEGIKEISEKGSAADKAKLTDIMKDVEYNENLKGVKEQIEDVKSQEERQEKQNNAIKKATKEVKEGEVDPTEVTLNAEEIESINTATPAERKNISRSVKNQVKNGNLTANEGQDVINKVSEVLKNSSEIGVQNSTTKAKVAEKMNELEGIKSEAENLDKLKFRDEATQKELDNLNQRASEIDAELKKIAETPESTSMLLSDLAKNPSRRNKLLRDEQWQKDNPELVKEIEDKTSQGLTTNQALRELSKEYETKEDPAKEEAAKEVSLEEAAKPGEDVAILNKKIEVSDQSGRKGIVGIKELESFVGEDRLGSAEMPTSRKTIDKLKEDIKKNGFKEPIVIIYDKFSGGGEASIIEGNHRYIAAKELGLKEIPVTFEKGKIRSNEDRLKDGMFPLNRKFIGKINDTFGVKGSDLGLEVRQPNSKDYVSSTKPVEVTTAKIDEGLKVLEGQTELTPELTEKVFEAVGEENSQPLSESLSKIKTVEDVKEVLIKQKQDAVQKPSPEKVDVRQQTKDGETVGERDVEVEVTAEEVKEEKVEVKSKAKEKIIETLEKDLAREEASEFKSEEVVKDLKEKLAGYKTQAPKKIKPTQKAKPKSKAKPKTELQKLAQQLRRDSKIGERALKLNKETITKIDEILKDLEKEYKELGLPKQKYTPAQVRRIIKSSVDTKLTQDSIGKILEGVNAILDPIIRKDNVSYLKGTLYSPNKLTNIGIEAQKKLKEIRDDLKISELKDKTTEELKALTEVVNEIISEGKAKEKTLQRQEDITKFKKQADVSKDLYKKEKFKELETVEEIGEFFNETPDGFIILNDAYELTKGSYKKFLNDNPFIPIEDTKAYRAVDFDQVKRDYRRNPIKVLRGYINPANQIATVENLMKVLWRGAPEIRKVLTPVVKQIKNAYANKQVARKKYTNMYYDYLVSKFGSKKKGVKELSKSVTGLLNPTSETVSKKGTVITNGTVGRLVAMRKFFQSKANQMREDAKELKGKAKEDLLNKADQFDKILERSGVNEKEFDKYLEANPKIKSFGEDLFTVFKEMSPDFAPTYEKYTNKIFLEDNYVPINRAGKGDETGIKNSQERLKNLDKGGDFIARSALSDRMKPRTDNADPIDVYLDATNMFVSYVESMMHAKEMIPVSKNINEVFNKSNIGAIYQKLGGAKFESLMEALDTQINLYADPVKGLEKAILELNRFGIVLTLAGSVKNIPKQSVSFLNYATAGFKDGINPMEWAAGYKNMLSSKEGREIAVRTLKSEYLSERIKKTQVDPLLSKAIDQLSGKSTYKDITRVLQQLAMSPVIIGDAIGVVSGGVPFTVAVHKQKMKEGMSFEDAWDYSYKRFVEESNESQQTSADYALGKVARSKLGKLFVTYKTAQTSAMNKLLGAYEDIRDYKNLNKNQKKQAISDAIWYNMLWSVPFLTVSNGLLNAFINDEDDDIKERKSIELVLDAVNSNLQGLGVPGYVANVFYDRLTDRPIDWSLPPVASWFLNSLYAADAISKKGFEDLTESEKKKLQKALGAKNVMDLYKNLSEDEKSVYDAIMNYQEGRIYSNTLRDAIYGEEYKEDEKEDESKGYKPRVRKRKIKKFKTRKRRTRTRN